MSGTKPYPLFHLPRTLVDVSSQESRGNTLGAVSPGEVGTEPEREAGTEPMGLRGLGFTADATHLWVIIDYPSI